MKRGNATRSMRKEEGRKMNIAHGDVKTLV